MCYRRKRFFRCGERGIEHLRRMSGRKKSRLETGGCKVYTLVEHRVKETIEAVDVGVCDVVEVADRTLREEDAEHSTNLIDTHWNTGGLGNSL